MFYPDDFNNKDNLEGLISPTPRNEFSPRPKQTNNHHGSFSQYAVSQQPGPYRVIYAKDKTEYRSSFDVIYHEPTKTGGDDSNVSMTSYRGRQHRSGGSEMPARRANTSDTLSERQHRQRSRLTWTFVLAVTAIFLSVVVTLQILSSYAKASIAAPAEILTFIEAVDSSVEENESYDRDVLRVQRLDDKLRLGRLLREIQRGGDDLREELNGLLMSESGDLTTGGYSDLRDLRLRATARLLWASKRKNLEDKVRRLDMLRMRFLVAYMGLVSAGRVKKYSSKFSEKTTSFASTNGAPPPPPPPLPPALPLGVNSALKKKMSRRRLSRAAAMGRGDNIDGSRKQGWAGVIRELQLSPLLQKRHAHASIGKAMSPIKSHFMVPEPPSHRDPTQADHCQYEQQKEKFPDFRG
ncbi:hypothetical protein INS49_005064 [Diaporthe citri]|uniref:uncharacterized protein n=1 Tax=Diaporthe citri TaxID=83186 RepID=UPI001C7E33D7|nr:uncharacterized protein INS49_005064 [Diaporthe citri]KAG6354093.1 hypothetical protein INS49_005064 [Diaporthe citri]